MINRVRDWWHAAIYLELQQIRRQLAEIRGAQTVAAEVGMATKAELDAKLDEATAAIASETDIEKSAVALLDLIVGMLQQQVDVGPEVASIQAIIDTVNTRKAELAAAVARDTPPTP